MVSETGQRATSSSNNRVIFFCLARGYPISKKYKYLKLILRNIFLKKHSMSYKESANWIFHEGNIRYFDQFMIRLFSLNFRIRFVDISEQFIAPDHLIWSGKSEYGLGYSLMCRFNYYQIWRLLEGFDTAIRVDDDVLVVNLGKIETDAIYVCSKLYKESHEQTNLSFFQYLENRNLEVIYDHKFPPNCFYVTQIKFWNKKVVQTFLTDIANSPLSLEHRWGDTVVMGVTLKKFSQSNSITLDPQISYIHLSHNLLIGDGIEVQIPKNRIKRYLTICKHYFNRKPLHFSATK
jgi:hypothetical protein